jgi:hypothetical protein
MPRQERHGNAGHSQAVAEFSGKVGTAATPGQYHAVVGKVSFWKRSW